MAGTDSTRTPLRDENAPTVILVEPQLGENIGMAARAMMNCGLHDLRLVRPRDGWPNPSAVKASSGAESVLDAARVFEATKDAVADLERVYATTARRRDMAKPVMTPRGAARDMRGGSAKAGVLFGKESKGLKNDDIALADAVLIAPLNPAHTSLNLSQAVLLIAYEWRIAGDDAPDVHLPIPAATRPANKRELIGLFEHLEAELDACGFLHPPEKRPHMVRNLRNAIGRAELTEQEVRTLRGVVACLAHPRINRS